MAQTLVYNTEIAGTGLNSQQLVLVLELEYASSRGISYDEMHVAVIDVTGAVSGAANTILERFTYLSKLQDGKSTEGGLAYFKDVINQDSEYIFQGAAIAGTIEPVAAGGGVALGSNSSALSSGDKFVLLANNATDLSGGTDDYAYTAGEVILHMTSLVIRKKQKDFV